MRKRAEETYDREFNNATQLERDAGWQQWLWLFAVRCALDERRWLLGGRGYSTAELESYISAYLMQPWNLKSDIKKAMVKYASQSDEAAKSCTSVKLLFFDHTSEEELCAFWRQEYTPENRRALKALVKHDTDELRRTLKELGIPLIKKAKGEKSDAVEAQEVLEALRGE